MSGCPGHLRHWFTTLGTTGVPAPACVRCGARPLCTVDGCDRSVHAHGWCQTHHSRWLRHGDPSVCPPTKGMCAAEGCEQRATNKDWCKKHYSRWVRTGQVELDGRSWGGKQPTPLLHRLEDKFTVDDGCWLWVGLLNNKGYGVLSRRREGRSAAAHRVMYELLVGPIPEGLELDHLCRVPRCVRPSHLEPVTHQENMARSLTAPWVAMRTRTHCQHGHALPLEPDKTGRRRCLVCKQIRRRKRYEQLGA